VEFSNSCWSEGRGGSEIDMILEVDDTRVNVPWSLHVISLYLLHQLSEDGITLYFMLNGFNPLGHEL